VTFRLLGPIKLCVLALALAPHGNAWPRQTETVPHAEHSIGTRQKVTGVPNFGQVSPNLYRGGLPRPEGFKGLKKMDIDVVVDLRGRADKVEETRVTKLGMHYVSVPSHCPFPSDATWARFLKVIRENQGKKVFVHCRLGEDRTGMAVAAYRMADEGWTAPEALREMRAFGFSTWHRAICPGMEGYVEGFPERLKKDPAFRDLSSPPQHGTR
jgi:tyrosine-protein phosphatase SIW14